MTLNHDPLGRWGFSHFGVDRISSLLNLSSRFFPGAKKQMDVWQIWPLVNMLRSLIGRIQAEGDREGRKADTFLAHES